jgi:hypothetical protein
MYTFKQNCEAYADAFAKLLRNNHKVFDKQTRMHFTFACEDPGDNVYNVQSACQQGVYDAKKFVVYALHNAERFFDSEGCFDVGQFNNALRAKKEFIHLKIDGLRRIVQSFDSSKSTCKEAHISHNDALISLSKAEKALMYMNDSLCDTEGIFSVAVAHLHFIEKVLNDADISLTYENEIGRDKK